MEKKEVLDYVKRIKFEHGNEAVFVINLEDGSLLGMVNVLENLLKIKNILGMTQVFLLG
jgi:hypothetical protein